MPPEASPDPDSSHDTTSSDEATDDAPGSSPGTPRADACDADGPIAASDDPRLDPAYLGTVPGDGSDVLLVGVVHDHPASVHRVRAVVRASDPAVVALELPHAAVPLFEEYARGDRTPPALGGEMSAAVRAAGDARVVGIDAPDRRFLESLAGRLRRDRPPAAVVGRLLRGLLSVTRHTLRCRLAAVLARHAGRRVAVDDPVDHAVDADDPPAAQAADERRQLRRGRSLLQLADTPVADLRDDLREASMATHLVDLRRAADGDVVAVLGHDHVDGVAREVRRRSR